MQEARGDTMASGGGGHGRRAYRILVTWYGLWQAGHVVFNLVALVAGGAFARAVLAPGLPEAAWRTMWVSGAADLLFASPTGILFAVATLRQTGDLRILGLASTAVATYSALLCYWVQWITAGRLLLDTPMQWIGLLTYLPCQALFFVLLFGALRSPPRR